MVSGRSEDDVDTDGPTKARKDEPKKAESKPTPESLTPKAQEKPVPKGPCSQCLGTGYIPISGLPNYVRAEGEGAKPEAAVPWKQCPKCQLGHDAKELQSIESSRDAFNNQKPMESKTGLHFSAVETRHVTLYGQDAVSELKSIAEHLEKLTGHLETITGFTVLTPCRPDQESIFVLNDQNSYDAMLSKAFGQKGDSLAFKVATSTSQQACLFWPKKPIPRTNIAVFNFASMLIQNATNTKCPPWLREGFAAYCEKAIMGNNMNYTIAYEVNEVKFEKDWNAQIKKFAEDRKLKKWNEMFPIDMISLGPLKYLTCYSMVSFLVKADPKAFAKMVAMIRDGEPSITAVEKAYGRKIDDLQAAWGSWCLAQK